MTTTTVRGALAALCLSLVAVSAHAADCSVSINPDGSGNSFLDTTNVLLNGSASDDCAGHYATGAASLANVQTFINGSSTTGLPLWGGNWAGAVKTAGTDGSAVESNTLSGLKFELINVVTTNGGTEGSFTLKVTDMNGAQFANLDATLDLTILLSRGAQVNDFYLFNDEVISAANNGTFTVGFTNDPGGPRPNPTLQALSHIAIFVRDIRSNVPCDPVDPRCETPSVPEPSSIALAALALLGASRVIRRRRG